MVRFRWSGSEQSYLDEPTTLCVGQVVVGVFGGSTKVGSHKNEDGALIWAGPGWTFAAVLDAHGGSQSTDLVLNIVEENEAQLTSIFGSTDPHDLRLFHKVVIGLLTTGHSRARLSKIRGETAALFVLQRGKFLSWISVGDNSLYLLHPQLARLGQYMLSVRNFFEWTGERDSLALAVPCYSSGVRELRQGEQVVALATDGLLEFGSRPYEAPADFSRAILASADLELSLKHMLVEAQKSGAKDSSTVIAWRTDCPELGLDPTA